MRILLSTIMMLCASSLAIANVNLSLPDRELTPGHVDSRVTPSTLSSTICTKGYTKTVRHTSTSTKLAVKSAYSSKYPDWPNCKITEACEVDHLISLELGGADVKDNLWPEPYCMSHRSTCLGAHEKDQVENYLHDEVCSGKSSLSEAQKKIATDWTQVWIKEMHRKPYGSPKVYH